MAAPASETGDYFGTYLDSLESLGKAVPAESSDGLAKIVRILSHRGRLPILELAQETHLALTTFTSELEGARTLGFVDVTGNAPDEQVALTPAGQEFAVRLTQP